MKVFATCGGCKKTLSVDGQHAGLVIRCPVCRNAVELPSLEPTESPSQPTSRSTNAHTDQQNGAQASRRKFGSKRRNPSRRRTPREPEPEPYDSALFDPEISSLNGFEIPAEHASYYGITNSGLPKRTCGDSSRSSRASRSSEWGPWLLKFIVTVVPLVFVGIALCFFVGARIAHSQNPDGAGGVVLSLVGIFVGVLLILCGQLGVVVNAFREHFLAGVLAIVVGFYAVWFAFTRWEENRHFVVMYVLGLVVVIAGFVLMPDRGVRTFAR